MNQVHGVRTVCAKCEGNAANHSRVESRTKLEVTDGLMDRQTDKPIPVYPPSTTFKGGITNQPARWLNKLVSVVKLVSGQF